jgi:hypothetical protein
MDISEIIEKKVKEVVPSLIDKKSKEYNLCIVSDTSIWNRELQWILMKQRTKVYEYDDRLFINRKINDFIDVDCVSLLWLNIRNKNCRDWIQSNYKDLHREFYVASVYDSFDEWIFELESDSVLSIKQFQRLKTISAEEMVMNLSTLHTQSCIRRS